jgi:hypothetical protein
MRVVLVCEHVCFSRSQTMARSSWRRPVGFVLSVLLALSVLGPARSVEAQALEQLTPGVVSEGQVGGEGYTAYLFEADAAGVLTVVARALDDTDLFLLVTDSDGQPVVDGRSDQDLGGDMGAEQFAVTLPREGSYQVRVEAFGGEGGQFRIGVSWLPFPDLALPPDPDGSPGSAVRLRIGQDARDDSLDGSTGDHWDWFVITSDEPGTLTVTTRAEDGDLVLEAFNAGDFLEPVERSDQDLQGTGGNEAVTLVVQPGEEFFFKVSAFSAGASISYRLQIGFIPE